MDELVARVRGLWAEVAGVELPERGLRVVCAPGSRMCPPGWVGSVSIGTAVLVTAPTAAAAARVEAALAGVPADRLRAVLAGHPVARDDAGAAAEPADRVRAVFAGPQVSEGLGAQLPNPAGPIRGPRRGSALVAGGAGKGSAAGVELAVDTVLGPAQLAYVDAANFDAGSGATGGTGPAEWVSSDALRELFDAADPAEVDESGLAGIGAGRVAVVREDGRIVAAAGHHQWPANTAHLGLLTARDARGRGLATRVAAAATADALAAGLLPQWRARVPASQRVAAKIGYRSLGHQLSVHLADPPG